MRQGRAFSFCKKLTFGLVVAAAFEVLLENGRPGPGVFGLFELMLLGSKPNQPLENWRLP
jgi:hypothetical protein